MAEKKVPDKVREQIKQEVMKGRLVILHPAASKKFKGPKVSTIDYPR
jgi:hypothetical protein